MTHPSCTHRSNLNEGTREKPLVSKRHARGRFVCETSTKGPGRNPWSAGPPSGTTSPESNLNEGTREKPLVSLLLNDDEGAPEIPQRRDQGETPGQDVRR